MKSVVIFRTRHAEFNSCPTIAAMEVWQLDRWKVPGLSIDFRSMPKAEVHVHLEGCFEIETIADLARENNIDLPRPQQELFSVDSLSEFLNLLDFICGLFRTKDQLAKAAYAFCQRLADVGTGYADVIVNPTHWSRWRNDLEGLVEGLDAGFAAAEYDGLPSAGLCVSLLRQQSASEAIEVVEKLLRLRHPRVAALSIDGNEALSGRTAGKFAPAFELAGRGGLKRTVHAGESSGPDGIRDAVLVLCADRIDHGVRAIEDNELMAILADRQVPLGICPTSNLALGLYDTLGEHPVDRLRLAGIPISVNTDDPAFLQTDLVEEYERTADAFGWDKETCRGIAATSIRASFAPKSLKDRLLGDLDRW
jgi:adenosine deaminase